MALILVKGPRENLRRAFAHAVAHGVKLYAGASVDASVSDKSTPRESASDKSSASDSERDDNTPRARGRAIASRILGIRESIAARGMASDDRLEHVNYILRFRVRACGPYAPGCGVNGGVREEPSADREYIGAAIVLYYDPYDSIPLRDGAIIARGRDWFDDARIDSHFVAGDLAAALRIMSHPRIAARSLRMMNILRYIGGIAFGDEARAVVRRCGRGATLCSVCQRALNLGGARRDGASDDNTPRASASDDDANTSQLPENDIIVCADDTDGHYCARCLDCGFACGRATYITICAASEEYVIPESRCARFLLEQMAIGWSVDILSFPRAIQIVYLFGREYYATCNPIAPHLAHKYFPRRARLRMTKKVIDDMFRVCVVSRDDNTPRASASDGNTPRASASDGNTPRASDGNTPRSASDDAFDEMMSARSRS